jgi:hypothetical protein
MKLTRAVSVIAFIVLLPILSRAGGDYVSGIITGITEQDGKHIVHFVQTDSENHALIKDCKEIMVTVKYSRFSWFSWLPFVKSSHPTQKETDESIEYLRKAHKDKNIIYFGYMGYGLVPGGEKCSFKSKGLKIVDDNGRRVVLSFHDET